MKTELERGICVYISKENIESLNIIPGFLEIDYYPDEWKESTLPGEIGRYLVFRFIGLNGM
jgi:hypothetical protein